MSPHLGAYGEKVAKTPNLDQLAREGVRYTHVYSTAGVCAPSRSALITGSYQTSIGTHNMRTLQAPVTARFSPVPTYSALLPAGVKCFPEYLRQAGYYCTNNEKQDYQFIAPVTVWDESSTSAHWRNRPADTPFFAVFNLMITHESQVFSRDKAPLTVDPARVEVPPYYPDNAVIRQDIARFLSNVEEMDRQVGELLTQLKEDGLYENTIIFFYSDHGDGLPFVKRELYQRGLKVPLLIRFPNAARAGTVDDQLISFVDFAPTVLSLAGVKLPEHLQGQAFLGNQQAKHPRKYIFAARDRMDTEYDRVRAVNDGRFTYLRNYQPERPYYQNITYRLQLKSMQEILRLREAGTLNQQQAYWFRPVKPAEELFDTKADPYEFTNLAENPAYRQKLQELRHQLEQWTETFGDLGSIPEKELLNRWWNGKATPPQTGLPVVTQHKNTLRIDCETEGASLAYKRPADKSWRVYTAPVNVQTADSLYVQAHRIGFRPSPVVKFKLTASSSRP